MSPETTGQKNSIVLVRSVTNMSTRLNSCGYVLGRMSRLFD